MHAGWQDRPAVRRAAHVRALTAVCWQPKPAFQRHLVQSRSLHIHRSPTRICGRLCELDSCHFCLTHTSHACCACLQVGKTDLLSDVRCREPITAIVWRLTCSHVWCLLHDCLQVANTDFASRLHCNPSYTCLLRIPAGWQNRSTVRCAAQGAHNSPQMAQNTCCSRLLCTAPSFSATLFCAGWEDRSTVRCASQRTHHSHLLAAQWVRGAATRQQRCLVPAVHAWG
jgi:hypothetical protein